MNQPRNRSWLHRLPVGLKLVSVSLAAVGLLWLSSPLLLLGVYAALGLLFATARIRPAKLWTELRTALWLALIALPINWLFSGWEHALLISGRLFAALALAALFTLCTATGEVLDAGERWFTRLLGQPRAERIGLMIALTIRSLPLLGELVHEVTEARRARGMERSVRALMVPVTVRALKTADELGEALMARGIGDEDSSYRVIGDRA